MDLSKEEIEEFIDIWYEEFGERLTKDAARAHATRVFALYTELYQRMSLLTPNVANGHNNNES